MSQESCLFILTKSVRWHWFTVSAKLKMIYASRNYRFHNSLPLAIFAGSSVGFDLWYL